LQNLSDEMSEIERLLHIARRNAEIYCTAEVTEAMELAHSKWKQLEELLAENTVKTKGSS